LVLDDPSEEHRLTQIPCCVDPNLITLGSCKARRDEIFAAVPHAATPAVDLTHRVGAALTASVLVEEDGGAVAARMRDGAGQRDIRGAGGAVLDVYGDRATHATHWRHLRETDVS
jgi:hypothetical protein